MYFLSHACNPNIQKVEETGQYAEGQPELHSKFQANLECTAKPCLKKEKPPPNNEGTRLYFILFHTDAQVLKYF